MTLGDRFAARDSSALEALVAGTVALGFPEAESRAYCVALSKVVLGRDTSAEGEAAVLAASERLLRSVGMDGEHLEVLREALAESRRRFRLAMRRVNVRRRVEARSVDS